MTPAHSPRIGVCSWSLSAPSPRTLAAAALAAGVKHIQLALNPIRTADANDPNGWGEVQTTQALRASGLTIISGMMAMAGEDYSTLDSIRRTGGLRPDSTWKDNLAAAIANARLARRLRIPLVTFHAGFIPPKRGVGRDTILHRLRTLADIFDDCGVSIALETGQETANTLLAALAELDSMGGAPVGVNFDPANMILYSAGDPVASIDLLAHRVMQVHIKDATPPARPGTWGTEVAAGTGGPAAVDWRSFFRTLKSRAIACDLVIEREAGPSRAKDVVTARRLVERFTTPARPRPAARRAAKGGRRR